MRYIKKLYNFVKKDKQAQKAENHLKELLENMCQAVDIRIADWDIDRNLFKAVVESPKEKLVRCVEFLDEYDKAYFLIKELDIEIPVKYCWFTNIKKHIQ